jgi:hypothetical protein
MFEKANKAKRDQQMVHLIGDLMKKLTAKLHTTLNSKQMELTGYFRKVNLRATEVRNSL